MSNVSLTSQLKDQARSLGFSLTGVCSAAAPAGYARFQQWLAKGYAGQMHYLPQREAAYAHPENVLEGVRSILMLGMSYRTDRRRDVATGQGRIASYAWSETDYHDVIHTRLKRLIAWLHEQPLSQAAAVRGVVDTAPLLEREFAQMAGLGWVGKNTLLLNQEHGSYFFLAALLTDLELTVDQPFTADHCGTCRACLDACPTDAFPQPYLLDATKCISYLTIELREPLPSDLRTSVGDWLFGCDVCQQVCPWNHHSSATGDAAFAALETRNPVDLIALLDMNDEAFRAAFRATPLWRSKRRGVLRNAAIVLGNCPTPAALPALVRGLEDTEPLIRSACAWALGKFPEPSAAIALKDRCLREKDAGVIEEIHQALNNDVSTNS